MRSRAAHTTTLRVEALDDFADRSLRAWGLKSPGVPSGRSLRAWVLGNGVLWS